MSKNEIEAVAERAGTMSLEHVKVIVGVAEVATALAAEKTVQIKIPVSDDERDKIESGKKIAPQYVTINGHRLAIERGVDIQVPTSISDILKRAKKN